MAQRSAAIRHVFDGGLATDFGPIAEIGLESDIMGTRVRIPWLVRAEDCYFQLDGSLRKIGGLSKVNSTEIASGEEIRGIFDYWRLGTGGTPIQKRVVYAGTAIYKDDADGTFTSIKTGLDDDTMPCMTIFNDKLILCSDSTTDVPFTWDQSTFANLGGSPPNFSFCVEYANRLWAAGDAANPSTLYYSGLVDETDWNGATNSGSLTISPDDGAKITGLASFRGNLIVFKGPYKGSIHVISGRTPATFARDEFFRGIGAVNHQGIFQYRDDLGFICQDGSVRTMKTVDRFGSYVQSNVAWHLMTAIRQRMNFSQIHRVSAAEDSKFGYVLLTVPLDGFNTPRNVIMMDYKLFDPNSDPTSPYGKMRFSDWSSAEAYCVAQVNDPDHAGIPGLMLGGNDGFLRRTQQVDRTIDGTGSINFYVETPHFTYGSPQELKTIRGIGVGVEPKGDFEVDIRVHTDNGNSNTYTDLTQGGGAFLGDWDTNEFVLDTSPLAGSAFSNRWLGAQLVATNFRNVAYGVNNDEISEDIALHSLTVVLEGGAVGAPQNESFEND